MAGSVNISSNTITGSSGTKTISVTVVGAGNIAEILDLTFASGGFQSITPPTGATGCVITPPATNLVALTLKGITGDTGISLQTNQAALITFNSPSSPAAFGLTAAAAISGVVELSFF